MTYISPQTRPEQGFNPSNIEKPDTTAMVLDPAAPNSTLSYAGDWSHATQELLNALPQVWTRGLLYCLIGFTAIVLPWTVLSKVDETGTARGRLETKEKLFKVDAPIAGTVAQVLVEEGQSVTRNQPLLKLESDQTRSELEQTQSKLEGQLNRLTQLELLKNQLLLATRTQGQQNLAQESEKLTQIEQARHSVESSKTEFDLVAKRFRRDQAEVERYRSLWRKGVVADVKLVEQEKIAEETQQQLAQAKATIHQAELRLKEQQNSYQSLIHSGRLAVLKSEEQLKDVESQMTVLQAEVAQSKSQIQAFKRQLDQHIVKTPTSGVIFQLSVQKPGMVVQPSTAIAEIAPANTPLILRAQIATSESGSLRRGMPVKLKFDAYPFQDHGVIAGHLVQISPTSKISDTAVGQVATFDLEIELAQLCIQVQSECIKLTPGQTATAEIIVRQRRIIDLLLDPFRQLQQGGLKL